METDPLASALAGDVGPLATASPTAASPFLHRLAAAAVTHRLPHAGLVTLRAIPGARHAVRAASLFASADAADWTPPADAVDDAAALADAAASAFEAAEDGAARAGAALAGLRAAVDVSGQSERVRGLFDRGDDDDDAHDDELTLELAATVAAALATHSRATPSDVASAARGLLSSPAVAAAVALNVDGALDSVCNVLAHTAGGRGACPPHAAARAACALARVAAAAPCARAAALRAVCDAGGSCHPLMTIVTRCGDPPAAALAAVRAASAARALPWLASVLATPAAAPLAAALDAGVTARVATPWTAADDADLRCGAALLAAGAPPGAAAAPAWTARIARVGAGLTPASRLVAIAVILLGGIEDRRTLAAAAAGVVGAGAPSDDATSVWLSVHLLFRRWGALADGLRCELQTSARFPDTALAALADVVGGGDAASARVRAARAAAALPPTAGLAAGAPPAAALAASAVAEALPDVAAKAAAGSETACAVAAALARAAARHTLAARLPLHPACVAIVHAVVASPGVALPPDAVASACAGLQDNAAPAVLASTTLLIAPAAAVWPPPAESLPLASLAPVVASPHDGCDLLRGAWLAAADGVAPGCVPRALACVACGRPHPALAAAPPVTPDAAVARLWAATSDEAGVIAALDAALPTLIAPTAPRRAADAVAAWLASLPPALARLARGRIARRLGCALDGDGRTARARARRPRRPRLPPPRPLLMTPPPCWRPPCWLWLRTRTHGHRRQPLPWRLRSRGAR